MRMRSLLAVAITASCFAFAGTAGAQTVEGPKINWKIGAWGKPRAATTHSEFIAKYVKEKTNGNFTWTIGYESFGSPKELLDLVSVGALDGTNICSSYHPEKHPAYTALDLPFLPIANADVQEKVHEAFHKHPYIINEMKRWNAQFHMSILLPQYEFIGRSAKPPKTLEDWKGLRVRAIGGIGEAMKRLGAVPTSVDATEVYSMMERGTVDAASFPSTYAHASYRVHEVGKWFTVNMAPGTQACPSLIGIKAWDKLPPQYRKLIDESKPLAYAELKKAYGAADEKNIPLFKAKKLEFITYTEADMAEFRKVGAQPVWDAWIEEKSKQGIPAKELVDLILTTAKANAPKS